MRKNTGSAHHRLLSKIALLAASSLVLLTSAAQAQTTITTAGTHNFSGNDAVIIDATSPITSALTITHSGGGTLTLTDVSNPGTINIGTAGTAFFVDPSATSEIVADFQNLSLIGDGGIDFRDGGAKSIAITLGQNSSVDFGYAASNGIIIRNTNTTANNTITLNGTITGHSPAAAVSATGVELAVTGGTNRVVIGQTGSATTTGASSSHAVQISDAGAGINIVENHGSLLSTGTAYTVNVTTAGGSIAITNTGNIEARSTAGAHAIYASASGTGAIDITASAGTIKTANGSGIYASNSSANAGNITIDTTGATLDITSTSSFQGIQAALSNTAATADISVTTGTGTIDTTGHGIYASNAGAGSITVNSSTAIEASGAGAKGILAQNTSASAGNINIASTGSIQTSGATGMIDGIAGVNSGTGDITIIASNNITLTNGGAAHGILADVTASGTGSTSINYSNGTVTTNSAEQRALESNIYGTTGGASITNSGTLITHGTNSTGIAARITQAGNASSINITNSGSITTHGNTVSSTFGAHGISAINQGSGDTIISATNGSSITTTGSTAHGINVNSTSSGSIEIDSAATITASGNGASGINVNSTDSGAITIDSSSVIAAENSPATSPKRGIYVTKSAAASGAVTITQTGGSITAASADASGIRVEDNGSGNVDVNVINSAIDVYTSNSKGIAVAKYAGSTGKIAVHTEGGSIRVGTHDGVASSNGAGISIGHMTTTSADAISMDNDGTDITIGVQGTGIGNNTTGIRLEHNGLGDVRLTSTGNITSYALTGGPTYGNGITSLISNAGSPGALLLGVDKNGDRANIAGAISLYGSGSADNSGMHGIRAANAGSGATVINTAAGITTRGNYSRGISGEATKGSLEINNLGVITTAGTNSHGIYASSVSGDVTINNQAAITTGVEGDDTKGNLAKGIYAVSTSGSIAITNTGDITTWNNTNTAWGAATGIHAYATTGGNIDITSSGNITSGTTAIYAYGNVANTATDQGSTINVNINGDINVTSASYSHAVVAQARGVNGVTKTTFDNGTITGPASGIIAGSDVQTSHASNTLNIGSNAVINTRGNIVELFINSGSSQAVIAQGALLEGDRGFCADVITDNGTGHTGQGTLSISNAGSIIARRANETTSALAVERNWLNNNLAIDTILASVEIVNSGTIEGARGIVSGHTSSTILASASITNTGTITARNTLGEAILLLDGNQNVTLGTGSVINGHIYSAEVGNTVTLVGAATEDANFIGAAYNASTTYTGLDATNNFASLTVKTDDLVNTDWTLNGIASQLDGINAIIITNGANNTVSMLTLVPSTAGDYTFDHALSGNGTLKISLQAGSDAITLGSNVGTAFQGTLAVGTGNYALTAGTDNETSLANANLRADQGSTITVSGNNTIGGFEFNGGDIHYTATIPGSLVSPDTIAVDQLTINNTAHRGIVHADMGWTTGVSYDPSSLTSLNLLDQDNGISLVTLISSANPVIGSASALDLVDLDGTDWTRVESDGIVLRNAANFAIGNAYYGYGLVTGQANDGLHLGYLLKRVAIDAGKALQLDNTSAALMPNDFTAQIDAASATVVVADTTGNGIIINNTANTIETLVVHQGTLHSGGDEGFGKVHTLVVESGALATVNGHCQTIDHLNVADGGSLDLVAANCDFTSLTTAVFNGYVRIGDTSTLSLRGTSIINDRINSTGTLDNQGQMLFSRTARMSATSSSTLQNRGILIAETGAQGGSLLNNTGLLLIAESPSGNMLDWNDSVNNFGVIQFAPENIGYNRFNIGNRYSGNGDLYLNAYLDTPANSQIDQVKVYGHASGVTKVYINNRGGKGGETEGEGILTISTFSSDAGAFVLGQPVLAGLTYYDLVLGSNGYDWYLQNDGNFTGGGSAILTGAAGNAVSWFAQNDSLLKRMGDIRLSDGAAANGTFWMRAYGQQNNLDLKIGGVQNSRLYTYGGDVGSDILLDAGEGMLATGAFVGYAGNRNNVRNADGSHGSMDSIYFGFYATYMHESGFYADFIAKGQTFTTDFDSYGTGGADSGSYDGWGAGTSLELGWQFESPKGWFVEPSVQAAYMHAFNDTYTTQQSLRVQMQDADILQFSGMVRFGKTLDIGEYLLQPYGKFGIMEQVTDGGHVRVEQGRWKPTVDGTSAVFGAGVNFQVSMNTQIHLDYEASFSEKNDKPWGINLGVTTRF